MRKVHWPPTDWDEDNFYRDDHTRLPTRLHPFQIFHVRGTGLWELRERIDEKEWYLRKADIDGIFPAFRMMLDAYEKYLPKRPVSKVYFIGTELRVGGKIKVGVSRHPERRLRQLQTAHPEPLQIFATVPGDKNDEQKYHRRWSRRRLNGEWFTIGDCVINEINRLNSLTNNEG